MVGYTVYHDRPIHNRQGQHYAQWAPIGWRLLYGNVVIDWRLPYASAIRIIFPRCNDRATGCHNFAAIRVDDGNRRRQVRRQGWRLTCVSIESNLHEWRTIPWQSSIITKSEGYISSVLGHYALASALLAAGLRSWRLPYAKGFINFRHLPYATILVDLRIVNISDNTGEQTNAQPIP